jgi:energy-coupling factor transporter transmembrane protein EcfT
MVNQPPPGSYPWQPQQGYGGWQAPYAPKVTRNGFAIAALILGILGFFGISLVLSIIFGCIALVQIGHRGQRGKAMAIIGIVLSALWAGLLVVLIVVAVQTQPERDAGGKIVKSGTLSVSDLRVNDCLNGIQSGGHMNELVTVLPCARSHDGQVIEKFPVSGGFPGEQSLTSGLQKCRQDEQSRIAQSPLSQRLELFIMAPNKGAWDTGNHTLTCAVIDKSGGKLPGPIDNAS